MTAHVPYPDQHIGTLTDETHHDPNHHYAGKSQVLLEWSAASRPFRKRTKEFYTTIAAMVFLLAVILFLIQEWLAIFALLAVAFVAYVFSTVPPEHVKHTISTFGVETIGKRYSWLELYEFWFEEKDGITVLTLQTRLPYPTRVYLLLGEVKKDHIKSILEQYLPFRAEPVKTFVDKAADWLSHKIPLEATA